MSLAQKADVALERAIRRAEAIEVDPQTRAAAHAAVAARRVHGLEEETLRSEWKNQIVFRTDAAGYDNVVADPAGTYLAWIRGRCADPFAMTSVSFRDLSARYGPETANYMAFSRWPCEIAWARRSRRSDDPRTAVLAQIFLSMVLREHAPTVASTLLAVRDLQEDLSWVASRERRMNSSEILHSDFPPSGFVLPFARVADDARGPKIDKFGTREMEVLAQRAAEAEDRDLRYDAARNSAVVARRMGLSRTTAVLAIAAEVGLSSDDLIATERSFLSLLDDGLVDVGTRACLPVADFVDFVRARGCVDDGAERIPASVADLSNERRIPVWLNHLPEDYRSLGARRGSVFSPWARSLVQGIRRPPVDLVVDYGLYLVSRSYTKSALGR